MSAATILFNSWAWAESSSVALGDSSESAGLETVLGFLLQAVSGHGRGLLPKRLKFVERESAQDDHRDKHQGHAQGNELDL